MRWVLVTAVMLFWFLALGSMVDDSPTMDEQNHLARGLAFVRTGDPRLSLEHPPLVNALSALPLLTIPEIRLPLNHPGWERQPPDVYWYVFAEELLWHANRALNLNQIVFLARFPIVLLTLGLALVGYRFALALWGRAAAYAACLLLLFDPNVLAHGRYTTTDLGGTLFMLLATLLLWRMWARPGSRRRWLWAALGMGLAFGSKLSILAFVPIWLLLALLPLYDGQRGWRAGVRRAAQFFTAGLASLVVVWAIFGFEWGQPAFLDARLAGLNALPLPMPTFWGGIERVMLLSGGGRAAYLLGSFSSEGFPLYFPVAWLVKTPVMTQLLGLAAAVVLVGLPQTRRRALFLLLPALLYFAISTQSALNLGYRHLLPMLPFVYLLIAGLASTAVRARFGRWTAAPVVAGVATLVATAVVLYPHYLAYFNPLAGGPANGRNILLDSNLDWGQDLLRLQDWMARNGVAEVKLAWFGTADPDYYGLRYEPLPGFPRMPFWGLWTVPPFDPGAPEPGVYAISASNLWEIQLADKAVYPWFRAREPDDQIGYSILIYRVE